MKAPALPGVPERHGDLGSCARDSARRRGQAVAVAMLALLLAGCVAGAGVLRVGINPLSPQYVRGQIISAMEMAGYRKVWFSSFDTAGERVPEIRSAGSDEYRFRREPDASYVARVYFDKAPSQITVRLDERSGAGSREAASAELARIRQAFSDVFGDITVR